MDTKPKRRWYRFHLSTAIILMLMAGVVLGVYVRTYQRNNGIDEKWQYTLENAMKDRVTVNFSDATNSEVTVSYGARELGGDALIFSPELANKTLRVSLNSIPREEALSEVCKRISAEWEIRNAAIFVYPKNHPPRLPKRLVVQEEWQADTLKKLSRLVSLEMIDTPASEAIPFLSQLTGIKISFDPAFTDPEHKIIFLCPFSDRRIFDALTCMCFQTGAEWELKKGSNGEGEIWIHPAGK